MTDVVREQRVERGPEEGRGPILADCWEAREALRVAMNDEVRRLVGDGVDTRVIDERGKGIGGRYLGSLIEVSLADTETMLGSLRHEVIHALRGAGAFSARDWGILEEHARKYWIERFGIEGRYPEHSEDRQIEEAVAEAYRQWYVERYMANRLVRPLFERTERLIGVTGEALREQGFHTADDIFQAIESGKIAGGVPRPDISGKGPVRVAEIEARYPKSEWRFPDARKAALDEAERLVGLYGNADTGWNIAINKESARKACLFAHGG